MRPVGPVGPVGPVRSVAVPSVAVAAAFPEPRKDLHGLPETRAVVAFSSASERSDCFDHACIP